MLSGYGRLFEAIGLDRDLVKRCFRGTPSRVSGVGFDVIAREAAMRHARAFPGDDFSYPELDPGGFYQWRARGERHAFNPDTVSKLQIALRRGSYEQEARGEASGIALGDLRLDPIERHVQRGERNIALSQREFELLLFLVRNADAVQARQTILDAVWGAPFVGDPNTLDVYMGYLRKKVEAQGEPQLLHTVRGVGFMARVGEPKA